MFQTSFQLTIGKTTFQIALTAESHTDLFKKVAFFQSLPQVGPNGETDLVLTYRVAQKQYEYYSIVSKQAGMEFKFGQLKESQGSLFSKGWEPLYQGETSSDEVPASVTPAGFGFGVPPQTQTVQNVAPATQFGFGSIPTPAPAAPTQAVAQTPAPTPVAANPAVSANAASVLAKFGL